jgi:hypothetical protein
MLEKGSRERARLIAVISHTATPLIELRHGRKLPISLCKQIRFCQAHHLVCLANGLAEPGNELELYTQWPRPAARGRGALNARLPSTNCSERKSTMISLTRQSP